MTPAWMAGLLLALAAGQAQDVEKEAQRLFLRLDADLLQDREAAESELIALGRPALPAIRRALSGAEEEVRWRLERAIKAIAEPRWIPDLDVALRKARETGRPLFVFSTMDELDEESRPQSHLMRRVTFADEKVVDLLNGSFIVCWHNHAPGRHRNEFEKELLQKKLETTQEGSGDGSCLNLVCAPDGAILSSFEGWYRPERFIEELEFGRSLRSSEDLKARQRERVSVLNERRATLQRDHADELRRPMEQSPIRRLHETLGWLVNSRVQYEPWVGRPVAAVLNERIRQNLRPKG